MIIQPYSYNGTLLQSTDYETSIPRQSALAQLESNLIYVKRAGAEPIFAGKDFQPVILNLEIKLLGSFMETLESLNKLFDVHDETPRQLIVQDTADSNKQYYVFATTKRVLGGHDGQMAIVTLGFDDPVWQSVTQNSRTWNISATGQSTDITNNGNIETYPTLELAVTGYPGTGYRFVNYIEYIPPTTNGWTGRPLELLGDTAGIGMDTAAMVAANKVQSSGNDFRVFVDDVEVPRWFGGAGFNTTDTKCWINIDEPPQRLLKLKTAIASTDSPTQAQFIYSAAYKRRFRAMPERGRFKINSEEFSYTGKRITATKLIATGLSRAQRNTAAASHASSDTVTWIPYDIKLVYGSSDAEAPDVDDAYKPIINLTTSNNFSFVYAAYTDDDKLRSGIWKSQIEQISSARKSKTRIYTGINDGGDTDPADVAGMLIPAYKSGGVWKAETSVLYWLGFFPNIISAISGTSERYQYNASTPDLIGIQTSADGIKWVDGKLLSTVATTDFSTWLAVTDASTDITVTPNAQYVRYIMSGTVRANANNKVYYGATATTVTLSSPAELLRRGEQSAFRFFGTFTVDGKELTIDYPLQIGQTLIVDTDPSFPNASLNGQLINGVVSLDTTRADWLPIPTGTQTILFTSNVPVGATTVTIKWRDRMNYL